MATYNIESFYRSTLQGTIIASDVVTSMKVFNVPVGTYTPTSPGFITVSPNTDNEEIFEFTGYDPSAKTLTISKRGISKTATTLTTDGVDYNNASYKRAHTINDSVRGDINHIHINQNFSKVEIGSTTTGQGASLVGIDDVNNLFTGTNVNEALNQLALGVTANSGFDAIVASTGGTHTLLSSAVNSGAQRILVRSGTYSDVPPSTLTSGASLSIVCESNVILNITATGVDRYLNCIGNSINIYGGKWNITQNNYSFKFIFTATVSSNIILEGIDVTFILNTGASQLELCTASSQLNDLFNAVNCKFTNTLGTATSAGTFILYNNNISISQYTSCYFSHKINGGGIGANSFYAKYNNCEFRADGSGATRNYLTVANCVNCIGYYSLYLTISNSSNNYFYANNMTSDANYNFGTTNFRMTAGGLCSNNHIEFNFSLGNSLKIGNGCSFVGNTTSGGEYIEIGNGDTQYNAKSIVNDNFFSLAFAQSSINSKVKIKQKFSQVSNNSFEFNYGSGSSSTGTLTIDTTANYSMVCNNIIASGSSTLPTIVDSSTGSVKTDNLITIS